MKTEDIQVLEERLHRSFRRLTPTGRAVLLGVSGGPDSMTLLSGAARLAGRLGLIFEAATVDHRLRSEARDEVALVARLARSLGVAHHVIEAPIEEKSGVEAAARTARYAALESIRVARGLALVATAHTASDQAETLLMRLARGTSLSGAASIHEARADRVIRPLLFATRLEVEAYVAARQLEVAHDSMNDDPGFFRVRIRQEVVPALEKAAGPGAERALARFATLAAEDEAWLSAEAARAMSLVHWPADDTLEAEALNALGAPIARRVLAQWLTRKGVPLDGPLLEDGLRAARDRSTATLPGDRVLACSNGRVTLVAAPARLHATSS
ncbi:MAG: tRNA lysidine(34) synthetase TilS [Archangium sp.]|nr:tRNA lysidine(34) synthetase TilS [Archangium sp.]